MLKSFLFMALAFCWHAPSILAFHASFARRIPRRQALATSLDAMSQPNNNDPQVFASGYSPKLDLHQAIQEATEIALQALPGATEESVIDFGIITVSSLYDGQSQPSIVVPAVLKSASVYGKGIQQLIGCTTGGIIASIANFDAIRNIDDDNEQVQPHACNTIESEGVPGVSVTLCVLPDVNVKVRDCDVVYCCRRSFVVFTS